MLTVTRSFEFVATHKLPYCGGKCADIHSHNYVLEVSVGAPAGPISKRNDVPEVRRKAWGIIADEGVQHGMIVDFAVLDEIVTPFIKEYDRSFLNARIDNPTTEEIVIDIMERLLPLIPVTLHGIELYKLRLFETSKCWVEWRNPNVCF